MKAAQKIALTIAAVPALGALLCSPALASQSIGQWIVGKAHDHGYYAATSTNDLAFFGKYCYPKSHVCYWLLSTPLSCVKDDQLPALINGSGGALAVSLRCTGRHFLIGPTEIFQEAFEQPDEIDRAIAQDQGALGIAFPMVSGAFRAERFPLSGATDALAALYSASGVSPQPTAPSNQAIPPASVKSGTF